MNMYTNGTETTTGKILYLQDVTILNPTHQQMLDAGWEVYEPPQPTDEEIAEMEKQSRIAELHQLLADSDYKVIKIAECTAVGEPLPYDAQALHEQRQAWRDEINELEENEQ